jgi:hypothetical protein
MSRVAYWLVGPALLLAGLSHAQQADPAKKAAAAADAEVRLVDGSSIRMAVLQQQIEVKTDYGTLTVPIQDVARIDFGVHLPDGLEAKIAKAIEQLGDENYKLRESALKDLIGWGPYAYAQVHRATKSNVPEVAKRADMALTKIRAAHAADKLRMRDEDVVVTAKFTLVGRITTPQLKARNETIGELNIDLAKLREIRWSRPGVETEVVVDAAKHGSAPNQWMDSGFEVQSGSRLVVAAGGTVDLWPQGGPNSGYTAGPKGYGFDDGQRIPGAQAMPVFPAVPGAPPGMMPPGAAGAVAMARPGTLLGRIGENGEPFVIGDSYDGAPTRDGKLYLHIVPSPWNCGSTGSYTVKITPRRNVGAND